MALAGGGRGASWSRSQLILRTAVCRKFSSVGSIPSGRTSRGICRSSVPQTASQWPLSSLARMRSRPAVPQPDAGTDWRICNAKAHCATLSFLVHSLAGLGRLLFLLISSSTASPVPISFFDLSTSLHVHIVSVLLSHGSAENYSRCSINH